MVSFSGADDGRFSDERFTDFLVFRSKDSLVGRKEREK
jgi:hypothetical protein